MLGAIQTLPVWIWADAGSVRNLIDEVVYRCLPFQPPLHDPSDVQVIGGNGQLLELKGFAVLPVSLGTTLLWHEFEVVPHLPLEAVMSADILVPHQCTLCYLCENEKRLQFGLTTCATCTRLKSDPKVNTLAQVKFVETNPKRRRNRVKIGANFTATLANVTDSEPVGEDDKEDFEEEPISEQLATPRPLAPAVSAETSVARTSADLTSTPTFTPTSTQTPISTDIRINISTILQEMKVSASELFAEKLQKVLANLKVSAIPIAEKLHRLLVQVVNVTLNAFAATSMDLGRTSVIVHKIKTADGKRPVRHQLRDILTRDGSSWGRR